MFRLKSLPQIGLLEVITLTVSPPALTRRRGDHLEHDTPRASNDTLHKYCLAGYAELTSQNYSFIEH